MQRIQFMRLLSTALSAAIAAALFAGCSSRGFQPGTPGPGTDGRPAQSYVDSRGRFHPKRAYPATAIPQGVVATRAQELRVRVASGAEQRAAEGGIYGSTFYAATINGYPHKNTANGPPTCSLPGSYVNSIADDGKGNLIDPDGGTRTIVVYKGPGLCGPKIGSIEDPDGQPSDAASNNALTGKIAVGNIFGNWVGPPQDAGISICSLSAGCTSFLQNPNMYEIAGVAMAKNGDCGRTRRTASALQR